jgi:RNA polymerase sigma factor (sigma-70 family)
MATGESRPLAQHLERLWNSGTVSGLSDAELVKRFTSSVGPAAEQAFEALLGRHGPMVLGVCRHILRRPQDVDDAFQATFLVLVRKARSIQVDESLGPWLYGVAYRTAIRARWKVARQRLEEMNDVEAAGDPASGAFAWEIRPMLHEELNRLPEKYRSPIVLCHLEGKSQEEAARMLDWPVGTLSGRLSRGRQLLKDRLQRRGLTASAGMLAARFPGEAIAVLPPHLVELTIKAALGSGAGPTISTSVLTLTEGVLNAMLIHSFKRAALILVSVAAVTGAFGFRAGWLPAIRGAYEGTAPPRQAETRPTTKPVAPASLPTQNPGAPGIEPAAKADKALDPFDALEMLGVSAKNSPNMARDPIPVFRTALILMVESPDGKGVAAISTEFEHFENNDWKRYEFPPGQTATPIAGTDVLTLMMKGESITEIAAFSASTGEWKTQRLLKPIKEQISPAVGPGCALFQESNNFYAFSAQRGLWDVLSLKDGEKPRAVLTANDIMVQQGDQLFVFPFKMAKWLKGIAMRPANKQQKPHAALEMRR